jgi:hypothetical protein
MPLLVRKFEEEKQDMEAIKKEVASEKEVKQLKKSKEKRL